MLSPKSVYVDGWTSPDTEVLDDILQEKENPVEFLKSIQKNKIIIVVPNEWSWPPEFKPFTNAKHKHHFDTDLLAQDLESAGLTYIIRLIEFSNWSFLAAEAVRNESPSNQ